MTENSDKLKILITGGAIRDLLLGRQPKDLDYLIASGTADDFLRLFPAARPVGKSYEIFYLKGLEFSFPRARGKNTEETINLDLLARDFTINSFALDDDGELYAHPQGLEDLHNRILRPSFPDCFKEDPLRVFRAAAFMARFPEFSPHPELIAQMKRCAANGWLEDIAPDRIGVELRKGLSGPRPGNFLRLLIEGSCLEPWFTEFSGADKIPAGPPQYHDKSVAGHTADIMDKVAGNALTCWMSMCHDLGKVHTSAEILPSHYGHDKAGAVPAKELGSRLTLPVKFIRAGETAALLHMKAGSYRELRPGTKVDLLMKLHVSGLLENMISLCHADRGEGVLEHAPADLTEILKVSLPAHERNLGKESGEKLRNMRAMRIKAFSRGRKWS
ncbi:polynucleotide adenylyltransferase [Desulfovibrio sp. JC010]|uniref:polynucleotide adenylyltransferase n=1 Tax=Desulfovibrio sp. JC010 TaxID=2593641 RepID=UPI0013D11039|nr:polynucleotide adenylyltransferase [Desulfovibrio sp. JC010]NDV28843.1 polynucleotide adenylyltransferase [Desulfovibrio sp. JC010]